MELVAGTSLVGPLLSVRGYNSTAPDDDAHENIYFELALLLEMRGVYSR